ncbi:MAG: VOC family protein [Xanthomonadales bacterium]|nr:VOC family protein [Xanthomonadales bacterium]
MTTRIGYMALLVHDYDEAIAWFCDVLHFELVEDSKKANGKRWVRVRPPGGGAALLLSRAVGADQRAVVGNQAGGRVFGFLYSDDFMADYDAMKARNVRFTEPPRSEPYGQVAVFEDLYGNRWDLLEDRR